MDILGYQVREVLYDSDNSLVYRAYREADSQPVILKLLKQAYPPPKKIAEFQREYEITKNLNLKGVVDVYRLETDQHRWVMILEDFGGESLARLMQNKQLTLTEFLSIALQVVETLGQVHEQHIMHKDINPSNIVWNPTTGQLKLIDFGISTVLSREATTFGNPNLLEGTLAYISPEQTGRMNRAIDYRTDFYSLGVTFYELLTGQLPFPTHDALELVHCHIARQPVLLHEHIPDIPSVITEIVLKLMAKNAEDRYQSAYGLKVDLEECLRQWQTSGHINAFPLSQQDVSGRFQIPQKLYGRQVEINMLLAAFERVSQGASEMMLVTGYSGVGKSALVQEVYKPITQQQGFFTSGKFDQFQRNIPYASLVQAFRSLIRQLLTESQAQIDTWREKLLVAFGSNGQVMIDVIPEVELIIGSQPAVPELAPAESQNRFNLVFQNFIRVFTQASHPLVIFLDDLQWADGASLKLIELLMTAVDSHYLLLIGAYRDNEVSATHSLLLTLNEIKKMGATVNQIVLTALDLPNVMQLTADALNCLPERVKPLSELVLAKTNGNPFFINEFLKSLNAEELLAFDFHRGTWQWDLMQIQARDITNNVVELMADKLRKLGEETQRLLKLAACIGNQFNLQTLAVVREKSPQATAADLQIALSEGLVIPLGNAYKLIDINVEGLADEVTIEYKFAHDRIQQAAYSLIPEAEKQVVHWQVGQLLLRNTPPDEREQKIFDIVNQLNQRRDRIEHQTERDELAQLNLMAGQKAKASAAYQPAFNYLQVGIGLLNPPESPPSNEGNSWQRHYDLTVTLYVAAAEAAYLNGHFQEVEQWTKVIVQKAETLLDQVKAYEIKLQAYFGRQQSSEAMKIGLQALQLLGVELPEKPSEADLTRRLEETKTAWVGQNIEDLIELPKMTDAKTLVTMPFLFLIASLAAVGFPELYPFLILELTNLSLQFGNTSFSSPAYAAYGLLLCDRAEDIDSGYQFGQLSLSLLDKFNTRQFEAKTVYIFNTFIRHWKEHIKESLKLLLEVHQRGLETGDIIWGCGALFMYALHACWMGSNLVELEQEIIKYVEVINQYKQELSLRWIELVRQPVLNLLGETQNPCYFVSESYDEKTMLPLYQEMNDRQALGFFYLNKIFLCYLFENYQQAIENVTKAEEHLGVALGLYTVSIFYFYKSLAQLAIFPDAQEVEQELILENVAANQEKMAIWAHHAPMNFLHKFYLVAAERDRVLCKYGDAREYYDRAINLAQENEYLNEEALAYELAGRFYLARGQDRLAHLYLHDAHYAYQRWGAVAKVKHLEARYPQVFASTSSGIKDTTKNPTTTGSSSCKELDLATVMKASQALAGEIVLDKLLEKLMKIAIENAGAQKGFLILETEGNWTIAASGAVDATEVTTLRSPLALRFGQSLPIDSVDASTQIPLVSVAIANYVARTKENVVLNDAVNEGQFTSDPYIVTTKPKSILCTPLLNQGKLSGILYLENNLTTAAFTPDRLEVLNLLSSQAAISIENARLYSNLAESNRTLETKVEERTAELAKAKDAAEVANQAKSTFLANMSHELRSPLNAILGFSQLMTKSQAIPPEHRENVGIITRSGEHLLTLINQVLDLSKIEAGRTTLNEKNFDLYCLLNDVEDMFQLKADEKGLRLICDRAPNVPRYVRTDEVKLRQVLINLLNNALKFTAQGGVSVRVRGGQKGQGGDLVQTSPKSPSSLLPTHYSLFFEVSDTGPGIAPEELDSLFEAFVQTKTGKESQEGTGLGLPISRRFVQLMGGEITVSSQVGRGTTFQFDITLSVVDAATIETKQSTRQVIALAPNQPRYRILIVDDKQDNRQLLIKLLNPLGFELKEASNGQEAVEISDKWEPHLIWMDMRMPVMDGYEATKQIKSTTKGQATAVIAMTASVLEEERAIVLSTGCDDFLRKPFREVDIFEMMSEHIGVHYIYEDPTAPTASPVSKTDIHSALTSEALAALPTELLANLEHAANFAYMKEIDHYIEEVRSYNATLADALATLALDFEYGKIVTLIQQAKK